MNYIAVSLILVLTGIGTLISAFLLGRWVEYKQHLESNKLTDEVYNRCLKLDRENKYLRSKVGLNNLTKDMGGK